jgi:hypothetical protein
MLRVNNLYSVILRSVATKNLYRFFTSFRMTHRESKVNFATTWAIAIYGSSTVTIPGRSAGFDANTADMMTNIAGASERIKLFETG